MPELPEVETVRRGLALAMEGRVVTRLDQRRPDLRFALPENFPARIEGRRILRLGRRAKYLLADIEGGDTLLMHLGMSGRFTIANGAAPARPGRFHHDIAAHDRHVHLVFHLEDGTIIAYDDPRRFGYMALIGEAELETCRFLAGLGPEPLGNGFNAPALATALGGRTTSLKAVLLNQRLVAGIGNIYACEALHEAALSPWRAAGTLVTRRGLANARASRLVDAVRTVLMAAIAAGGSTLRDFAHADGELGYFQHSFKVYDRDGQPCPRAGCGGTVRRKPHNGRSTFYCPRCQK